MRLLDSFIPNSYLIIIFFIIMLRVVNSFARQHTTKRSPTAAAPLEISYISHDWLINLNDNYEYISNPYA